MTQIATDKILSEEEFDLNLENVLHGSAEYKFKGMARLNDSHRQLAALCRAQRKAIRHLRTLAICYAEHYASALGTELHPVHAEILEQAEELLAAFPETLKQKTA